jgi:hypothetical protein
MYTLRFSKAHALAVSYLDRDRVRKSHTLAEAMDEQECADMVRQDEPRGTSAIEYLFTTEVNKEEETGLVRDLPQTALDNALRRLDISVGN